MVVEMKMVHRRRAMGPFVPQIERGAMAYDRSKRLLLNALLKGLDHAIRRDDLSAVERYCKRLHLTTEPISADALVKGASKQLLSISGLWMKAPNVERDETRQQLLELIDCLITLLA
jgi:hypothetical protein